MPAPHEEGLVSFWKLISFTLLILHMASNTRAENLAISPSSCAKFFGPSLSVDLHEFLTSKPPTEQFFPMEFLDLTVKEKDRAAIALRAAMDPLFQEHPDIFFQHWEMFINSLPKNSKIFALHATTKLRLQKLSKYDRDLLIQRVLRKQDLQLHFTKKEPLPLSELFFFQ